MNTGKAGYILERAGRAIGEKHRIFGIHYHVESEHRRIEVVKHHYTKISAANRRDALALYASHIFGGKTPAAIRLVVCDEGADPHTPQLRKVDDTRPSPVPVIADAEPVAMPAPQPASLMGKVRQWLAVHPHKAATAQG